MSEQRSILKDIKISICQFFIDFGEQRMVNAKNNKVSLFWSNFCGWWLKL